MATWRGIAVAAGLAIGGLALGAPPTAAQDAPQNGILVIYGNQKCPTDTNGNEIVVCRHRSAAEQFRIPKELREFKVTPENESWAVREKSIADVGDSGIGSCSVVGAGGTTGCFIRTSRADRKDNKDREETQSDIP
jgi:hypothetical protein